MFLLFVGPRQQLMVKGYGKTGSEREGKVSAEIDGYRKGRENVPVLLPSEV
jgi:hypothetical protein